MTSELYTLINLRLLLMDKHKAIVIEEYDLSGHNFICILILVIENKT